MKVDASGLRRKIEVVARRLPDILKTIAEELEYQFQAFAEERFHEGSPSGPGGKGNELFVRSGGLTRSLIPGQPGNISDVKISSDGRLSMRVGSSLVYGRVQEYGGFIKSKGRMHKYFWAMFYKTRDEYYKAVALSVEKNGGIRLPARPWFNPAVKELKATGDKFLARRVTALVLDTFRTA